MYTSTLLIYCSHVRLGDAPGRGQTVCVLCMAVTLLGALGLSATGLFWFLNQGNTEDIAVAGTTYRVLRDTPQRMQEVATLLAQLRTSLQDFVSTHSVPDSQRMDPALVRVAQRWSGSLRETERGAYTVDKAQISICVRHPRTGQLQSWDTCVFVALHELAHIATSHIGHTQEFWANFGQIVAVARADGLVDPAGITACYCGAPTGGLPHPVSLNPSSPLAAAPSLRA